MKKNEKPGNGGFGERENFFFFGVPYLRKKKKKLIKFWDWEKKKKKKNYSFFFFFPSLGAGRIAPPFFDLKIFLLLWGAKPQI